MPSRTKSKQLSVLIAGGTSLIGRELVSRLVSHPDVSRVVVLSRRPIPVDRWQSFFPKLHTGDALRYLSIVTIDWDKMACDAARIPVAYVTRGEWVETDADTESPVAFTPGTFDGNDIFEDFWSGDSTDSRWGSASTSALHSNAPDTSSGRGSEALQRHGLRGGRRGVRGVWSRLWAASGAARLIQPHDFGAGSAVRHRGGQATGKPEDQGMATSPPDSRLRRFNPEATSLGRPVGYVEEPSGGVGGTGGGGARFLEELLRNPFYCSVFRGHHVVISSLDTHHPLSSTSITLVNYRYSISFAKMTRIFNSMVHAEPTEEEEEIFVKKTSKELGSVLWGEICTACYGKIDNSIDDAKAIEHQRVQNTLNSRHMQSGMKHHQQQQQQGSDSIMDEAVGSAAATLKQFTQVSVMGASEFSPFPYFRVHGQCDSEVLRMFNRDRDSLVRNQARLNRESDEGGDERIARRRAELLLRRDVVKTCNNNHITLWRPGIFERPLMRWTDRLLGSVLNPVRADYLAELIVDDIMESIEDEREFDEMGTVKIVSGKSVAVRARMKLMEDQLNRRDTQHD